MGTYFFFFFTAKSSSNCLLLKSFGGIWVIFTLLANHLQFTYLLNWLAFAIWFASGRKLFAIGLPHGLQFRPPAPRQTTPLTFGAWKASPMSVVTPSYFIRNTYSLGWGFASILVGRVAGYQFCNLGKMTIFVAR